MAVYIKRIKLNQVSNLFKSKGTINLSSKFQINCIDLSKYKKKNIINKKLIKKSTIYR